MPIDGGPGASNPWWSKEQLHNANIIAAVGREMGMSRRDIHIALMTAMQESNLINVKYGDRDSQGLFQQRPSQGWGTVAQVTDPRYSAGKFFQALKGVTNRDSQALWKSAYAVQKCAAEYATRYADHRASTGQMMLALKGGAGGMGSTGFGGGGGQANDLNALQQQVDNQLGSSIKAITDQMEDQINTPGISPEPIGVGAVDAPMNPADVSSTNTVELDGQIQQLQQLAGGLQGGPKGGGGGASSGAAAKVEALGRKFLGIPYVWGGTTPSGFDCSGLLQYIYAKVGVNLPRISADQARFGPRRDLSKLKPGDLVAWDNSSRNNGADHIAMYIGGGMIIEAPRPGSNVQLSSLYDQDNAWGVSMQAYL